MARNRTLTQLIADVRQRADVENSQHVSDAEVTRYINQGVAALHALIVENNEDEYAAETTISVTAGTVTSPIIAVSEVPVGPYKILAVDVIDSSGSSFPVRRFSLGERAQQDSESSSIYYPTRYRLRGTNSIIWSPPFEQDVSVRVTYVASAAELSGSDTYDGRDGWEEWITLDAAIKVMTKEETDDSQLVRERALVEARILKQIARHDLVEPGRIRDVWTRETW